jgi:mono/diheme cytochrome c family protein
MGVSRRPAAIFTWLGRYRLAGSLAGLAMAAMFGVAHAQHPGLEPLTYTDEQAARGKGLYDQTCAACHGANLEGSGPAVGLQGRAFQGRWTGKSADQIFTTIRHMPPGRPVEASASDAAASLAYVLKANGAPTGSRPVPEDAAHLSALAMPFGGAAPAPKTLSIVGPPAGPSRLDNLRPVAAAELETPSPDDWLIWRRTYDSFGFSPLS